MIVLRHYITYLSDDNDLLVDILRGKRVCDINRHGLLIEGQLVVGIQHADQITDLPTLLMIGQCLRKYKRRLTRLRRQAKDLNKAQISYPKHRRDQCGYGQCYKHPKHYHYR